MWSDQHLILSVALWKQMTYNAAGWNSHVTRQLNNMQIERQQWIALRGVICPVESATGSQCASMHGHWVSMKPFGLLPPIPNIQTPLMDYSSVRVLSVHFELMNLNFLYTLWLHECFSVETMFPPVTWIANFFKNHISRWTHLILIHASSKPQKIRQGWTWNSHLTIKLPVRLSLHSVSILFFLFKSLSHILY